MDLIRREEVSHQSQTSGGNLTHVSWSPAGGGHHVACPLHLRQAKVADHDLGLIVGTEVEEILRLKITEKPTLISLLSQLNRLTVSSNTHLHLQISVHDAHGVQVVHRIQNLPDESAGIHLCVEAFLHDAVEQLTSRHPVSTHGDRLPLLTSYNRGTSNYRSNEITAK